MSDSRAIETARELRAMLIIRLVGFPASCQKVKPDGTRCGRTEDLQIEHCDGRPYQPRELDSYSRIRRYWLEYLRGVRLSVYCKPCNGNQGARIRNGQFRFA